MRTNHARWTGVFLGVWALCATHSVRADGLWTGRNECEFCGGQHQPIVHRKPARPLATPQAPAAPLASPQAPAAPLASPQAGPLYSRRVPLASPQAAGAVAGMGAAAGVGAGALPPIPQPSELEPYAPGTPGVGQAPSTPQAPGAAAAPSTTAPSTATPTTPSTISPFDMGAAAGAAPATGLGGGLGGPSGALVMIGDQAPGLGALRLAQVPGFRPPVPPPPSPPGSPSPPPPRSFVGQAASKGEEILPWIRGFKIADNMSPLPQDRVFFSFNYYNNLNYAVNSRINAPVDLIQVYRYQLGLEKTFLDGNASIGLRDGLNTLTANSPISGLGGTNTGMGDLTVFSKFVLWQNWDRPLNAASGYGLSQRVNGGLISSGLAVTVPTGPGGFAGAPLSRSFRNTQLQPYLGYYWTRGNVYVQGFEAINIPTDPHDVTMLFTDVGAGYFFYRSPDPQSFLTAAAATFEVHVNDPLNHHNPFVLTDLAGTPHVLDLTAGTNFFLSQRALVSLAMVTPITGPRPFDFEVVALLNVYFGGSRGVRSLAGPPVVGN